MRGDHAILVRHIPRQLRDDQIEDLFTTFGAARVRILSSKQKKTALAFVTFRSLPEAQCAVTRVHQMEVLGYRLSAELSNQTVVQEPPGRCTSLKDKEDQYLSLLKSLHLDKTPPHNLKYLYPAPTLYVLLNIASALYEHRRLYTQVLHLMNKMNLPCPFDPHYVRACKIDQIFMHGKKWTESQLCQNLDDLEVQVDLDEQVRLDIETAQVQDTSMVIEESDTEDEIESEMEDTEENVRDETHTAAILNLKRTRERKKALGVKRRKFIKPMLPSLDRTQKEDKGRKRRQEGVFEPVSSTTAAQRRKQIQVKVPSDFSAISTPSTSDEQPDTHSLPVMPPRSRDPSQKGDSTMFPPIAVPIQSGLKTSSVIGRTQITRMRESNTEEIPSESSSKNSSGYPFITPSQNEGQSSRIPHARPSHPVLESSEPPLPSGPSYPGSASKSGAVGCSLQEKVMEETASAERPVISKERLDCNRLSERDRSFVKAFNNYSPGIPSCRLYVKNLAKSVTQEDVEFVFRRYYMPDYNEQGTLFDVRLMQEGRMKGQAFITLQTVQQARQALQETNGFLLKDKPMVVQYARSIQAKPAGAS